VERLVVCPGCQRYVKAHDARCPFCRRASMAGSRGVALVGAVVVGAGLSFAACGGQSAPADGGADSSVDADDGGMVVMYGPAPFDAAADADGGLLGAYGPPPPQDGGQD
jgi:hypothetical protein